jgi:hypothetical protein
MPQGEWYSRENITWLRSVTVRPGGCDDTVSCPEGGPCTGGTGAWYSVEVRYNCPPPARTCTLPKISGQWKGTELRASQGFRQFILRVVGDDHLRVGVYTRYADPAVQSVWSWTDVYKLQTDFPDW